MDMPMDDPWRTGLTTQGRPTAAWMRPLSARSPGSTITHGATGRPASRYMILARFLSMARALPSTPAPW